MNSDKHTPTQEFLDVMYAHSLFPYISKPTRVTKTSATIIDHILTNNFDSHSHHKQGIICSSISDHFSVFHIATDTREHENANSSLPPVLKRNITQRNIQKFINDIRNISWQDVEEVNDVQIAYNLFQFS